MTIQQQPSTNPADLAILVNTDRIRSTLKRLFHNSISEIAGEVIQNGQRAGAKNMAFLITPDGFSIQDDGHGILNGVDGFHTLLKLAESSFDNPTIDDQDPMGIGIVSLLTHDQVEEVTFASNGLQLRIDAKRWWDDREYYQSWFTRLEETTDPVDGLLIYVRCKAELSLKLREAFVPSPNRHSSLLDRTSPAEGYKGILKITLDGKPVKTSIPDWALHTYNLIETTYEGSKLTIGYDNDFYRRSAVRWYGQMIALPANPHSGFLCLLDVRSGRPVNPLSPSRSGIIEDDAYVRLLAFVQDEIFRFMCDPANRAKLQPKFIDACYSLNKDRARKELPYITARPIPALESTSSFEDYSTEGVGDAAIFTYDDAPLLLENQVNLLINDKLDVCQYGLRSFVPQLANPYELDHGDESRLQIAELCWKPGPKTTDPWFFQQGEYGISYEAGKPPATWEKVTAEPVFTFNETCCGDIDYVDFTVGTTNPIDFLQNEVWVAFSPSDDVDANSYETQEDGFRDSVESLIRTLLGRCVPRDFRLYDLEQFIKENEAVAQVTYRYKRGTLKKDGTVRNHVRSPAGLTLLTSTGRKINLKFY